MNVERGQGRPVKASSMPRESLRFMVNRNTSNDDEEIYFFAMESGKRLFGRLAYFWDDRFQPSSCPAIALQVATAWRAGNARATEIIPPAITVEAVAS